MAKPKKTKNKEPRGKNKKIWMIVLVIIVALTITFGIGIAFNLGNIGIRLNNFLAGMPVAGNIFEPIDKEKTPEQLEEERLENTRRMLEQERENLDEWSDNLAAWELQLKTKEEELNQQKDVVEKLQQRLETRLKSIQELVAYYESMDAEDAVNILNNISDNDLVVVILKNMKQQKSSEILAAMDPRKAARLMEIMSAM